MFLQFNVAAQTIYTFTTCGKTARMGPSAQNDLNTAYPIGNSLNGQVSFNGYKQKWTIPASGMYTILVKGAMAGQDLSNNLAVGKGAIIQANIYFNAGEVIKITIGQKGVGQGNATPGGGGTYITYATNNVPIIVSGGGGGASYRGNSPGINASTSTSGTIDASGTGVFGSNGGGGWGSPFADYGGGGGGGFSDDGTTYYLYSTNSGGSGHSFLNDGLGGHNTNAYYDYTIGGGFGGGGGCSSFAGGAGGGYSGGAGGAYNSGGGGGGSYLISTATNISTSNGLYNGLSSFNGNAITNLNSYNAGDGVVVITRLMSAGTISGTQNQCGILPYTPNGFSETAAPSGGTGGYHYQWQSSTDNSNFTDLNGATNATYTPSILNSFGVFYFRRKVTDDAAVISYTNTLTITVDAIPTTPTASNIGVCLAGTTATLTANIPVVGTGSWSFLSGPSTPTISNISSPTSTVTGLGANGNYNLKWTIASTHAICSASITSTIVVGAPMVVSTNGNTACANNVVSLLATANAGSINWYSQASGGIQLGSGNNFNTPILMTTTNFYAEAVGSGCVSATRSLVTATILAVPNITITGNTTAVDIVNLSAAGGNGYLWSGGNAISNSNNSFDRSGTYSIQVIGANGCQANSSVDVHIQHWGLDKYGKFITDPSLQINHFGKMASNYCITPKGKIVIYQ